VLAGEAVGPAHRPGPLLAGLEVVQELPPSAHALGSSGDA
jgi:hypothetical protein